MKYEQKLEKEYLCPIDYGLEIFGGKWKSRIICVLSIQETMRYKDIKEMLSGITDSVLSDMLKDLISHNIVSRKQYSEIPPRVEYTLTNTGREILPILKQIGDWSLSQKKHGIGEQLPIYKKCIHIDK